MHREYRFKQIYNYRIGDRHGIVNCIEHLEVNNNENSDTHKRNLDILNREFHKSAEYITDGELKLYKFRYTRLTELYRLLIFRGIQYIDNLYELLLRNVKSTTQTSRNKHSETVDGIYNDSILHDGLASYGIKIDLVNKEVSLSAVYSKGRKSRV